MVIRNIDNWSSRLCANENGTSEKSDGRSKLDTVCTEDQIWCSRYPSGLLATLRTKGNSRPWWLTRTKLRCVETASWYSTGWGHSTLGLAGALKPIGAFALHLLKTVWCHVQDLCKPTFEVVSDTSICVTPPPSPSPPMHVRDTCSACAAKSCVHTRDNYSLTDWFIFHTVAGMSYAKSLHERKVTFINSVVPATKS